MRVVTIKTNPMNKIILFIANAVRILKYKQKNWINSIPVTAFIKFPLPFLQELTPVLTNLETHLPSALQRGVDLITYKRKTSLDTASYPMDQVVCDILF
jgi:hypothetical protein